MAVPGMKTIAPLFVAGATALATPQQADAGIITSFGTGTVVAVDPSVTSAYGITNGNTGTFSFTLADFPDLSGNPNVGFYSMNATGSVTLAGFNSNVLNGNTLIVNSSFGDNITVSNFGIFNNGSGWNVTAIELIGTGNDDLFAVDTLSGAFTQSVWNNFDARAVLITTSAGQIQMQITTDMTVVPAPGAFALAGLAGGLAATRRRRPSDEAVDAAPSGQAQPAAPVL